MPPSAQACTKQLTVKHRWTELLQKLRWTSVWKGSNVPYCYYIAVPYGNNPPPCVYAMAGEAHGGGPRDSLVHLWQLYEHLSLWLGKCLIFTQINVLILRRFSTLLISKWILIVLIDTVEGLLCAGDDWVQTSSPSESWLKAYKGHWWGKRVSLSPIISLFCCHSERRRLRGSIHRRIHNSHFLFFFFFTSLNEDSCVIIWPENY